MYLLKLLKLSNSLYESSLNKEAEQIITIANNSIPSETAEEPITSENKMHKVIEIMWKNLKERMGEKGGSISEDQAHQIFKSVLEADARCAYCNKVIQPSIREYPLDRIDNNKEYQLGNLVFACSRCNAVKANSNIKDLLAFSADIVRNLNYRNSEDGKIKIKDKAQDLKSDIENKILQMSTQTSASTPTQKASSPEVKKNIDRITLDILKVLTDLYLQEKEGRLTPQIFEEIDRETMLDFLDKFRGNLFQTLRKKYPGGEYGDFTFTYSYLRDNVLLPALNKDIPQDTKDAIDYITQLTEYEKNKKAWNNWYDQNKTEIDKLMEDSNTFQDFSQALHYRAMRDGYDIPHRYIQNAYNKRFKNIKNLRS